MKTQIKKKQDIRNNKAITLIALVVTIIVLLILAGVSITMVAGDNGIATKAKKSAEQTDIGNIKEKIKLEVSEKYTDNLGTLTEDEFVAILENYGTLSAEENMSDRTLTTDPDKTDTNKSYTIKVSELYNGAFSAEEVEVEEETGPSLTGNVTTEEFTFSINGSTCTGKKGMTWYDYINSDNVNGHFTINIGTFKDNYTIDPPLEGDGWIGHNDNYELLYQSGGGYIYASDVIEEGHDYYHRTTGGEK